MAVMKKKMAGTSALCAKLKASRANARVAVSNPLSVLRSSEKVGRSALLVQLRCNACHGLTVRGVMVTMAQKGATYKMADLKYDIMNGRLEVLKPGSKAGPLPEAKARPDCPCSGQPLPDATLDEFFQFLQCQLRMQSLEHTGNDVALADKGASGMWPEVKAFVTPNLGATERWVPYHTILGVHELFLVQSVHHRAGWSEKQKFLAMFVFRAHCKRDLFLEAQLPIMSTKAFWQDPVEAFAPGGSMEQALIKYRKKTGKPLITSCFRIVPPRVLKDDTENLVRSVTTRTQTLLQVAEAAFPVVKDKSLMPYAKLAKISKMITEGDGCGDTWAKMLTVCIDMAYPSLKLLESQCEVGTGAAAPLKCLLPKGGPTDKKEALKALLKIANNAKGATGKHFWKVLREVEGHVLTKYKKFPLVCAQASTKPGKMTAMTLQVQLCEYRQFRHSIARSKYGLADDENMRGEPEQSCKPRPEDFMVFDKKTNVIKFEFPSDIKKVPFSVSVKEAKSEKVAIRVASMCFKLLGDHGMTKNEVENFQGELLKDYRHGDDVANDSEAWRICKASALTTRDAVVAFQFKNKDGSSFPLQTTVQAAGGILQAERISRLCWTKLNAGMKKDAVVEYRNGLYKQLKVAEKRPPSADASNGQPIAKKRRI